jgi:hypothetical protein
VTQILLLYVSRCVLAHGPGAHLQRPIWDIEDVYICINLSILNYTERERERERERETSRIWGVYPKSL